MFNESLLEFEESLSLMGTSNELMLSNLDLKVELNRFSETAATSEFTDENLTSVLASYDFLLDQLTPCCTCGTALAEQKSQCCTSFIESHRDGFSSELEKLYWLAFLNDPYKTVVALPNYSKMQFLQSGIPFQLRPLIWQKLLLVNQENNTCVSEVSRNLYLNFQHSYNRDIAKQINKDLTRTFPQVKFFEQPETVNALLTILNVYANYDLELGYCQGLLFLVGTLYYHFRDHELTFHALCKIMECEPDLRNIFMPSSMLPTLSKWYDEFVDIFMEIDPQLAAHLTAFCDCKVFLYQWWLSFSLIHAPEWSINNLVIDFSLVEGWKVATFKISIGLLVRNKPILMSFTEGDEEVVYQHLLNESKWGNAMNSLTAFFGDLLLSWDDSLFSKLNVAAAQPTYVPKKNGHLRNVSVLDKLKSFGISSSIIPVNHSASSRSRSGSENSLPKLANRSLVSVFSRNDAESIYSDVSSYSEVSRAKKNLDAGSIGSREAAVDELVLENQVLKFLLKKAFDNLADDTLRQEIAAAVDLEGY